ncbi:flagellin [Pseudacidobacterium ailaaui]|jgi:flagellin|uniref:flagellin n=1 Tax=Pseudacidobacterium ailaaui TaxID=1382359 RepID=UPI000479D81F|nr:flagellin [Pseudacidobacterium ailaaui]MBX6360437.1 flagellin [Pseudacidobacterium ailaaui]MCL6462945.1 flagellin [Pseudacidobacterium ailaaui]MDI3254583.1 flagellin [Bacillota bacterium]
MSLGVLNNISAVYAANNLNQTQLNLQKTLQQLSSGSRINSGADDAAGLSLANGLQAASTALSQSASNASEGVDFLQVADGAMSQITSLLNRAVTLATEASNGTLNSTQISAANSEYLNIIGEINNINTNTEYNGIKTFGTTAAIYTSDGTTSQQNDTTALAQVDSTTLGLTFAGFTDQATAQAELTKITSAISTIAADRGTVGAQINTLQAVSNVMSTESTNTLSAENDVMATDYATATSNLSKYEILSQTGISALAQANSAQQLVEKLLQ